MMSQFEFIFSLYSLLLGLSLVELLSGLGKTVKARLHVDEEAKAGYRVGWLTPLLGLFVMLDLLSFWGAAWAVRDIIAEPLKAHHVCNIFKLVLDYFFEIV